MPFKKIPLTCPTCQTDFLGKPDQNYCSIKCRVIPGRPPVPLEERFWPKVDKNGPLHPYDPSKGPCWLWTAGTMNGYGAFGDGVAHRTSWEILRGAIPDGLYVCHSCDVKRCVNAETHLFLGTHDDNMSDMSKKGRRSGQLNPNATLTESQVEKILALQYDFTQTQLAEKFGVSQPTISRVMLAIRKKPYTTANT